MIFKYDVSTLEYDVTTLQYNDTSFGYDGLVFNPILKGQVKGHATKPKCRTVLLKGLTIP